LNFLNYLIFKNYKIYIINLLVFVIIGIIFTFSEKTYKTYISEIKIFSEPVQTESKNILPYLYSYNSDEQNNQVIIADIISRDLIEGFIKKYNYNFRIVSKEPKNLEIYSINIKIPLEQNRIYKIKTNENGNIEISSNLNGFVEIIGTSYYQAYNDFLRNMGIQTYSIDEMLGMKKQSNIIGFSSSELKVISISLYSSEPFINELADRFKNYLLEYNLEKKMKKFKNSKEFISKQISSYLTELDNLNYKIRTLQLTNNFTLDDNKNPILNELFEINKKKTQLLLEIQSLNEWLNNSRDENEIITSDPFIQKAISNIISFKDTLNILLAKYGSSSIEYVMLYNSYKKLRDELENKIKERIKNLNSQLSLLKKNEIKLRNELSLTFETEKEAISLISRKKAIEDIITLLSQRMEEIKIQEAEIMPDFKIIGFTEKPYINIKGRNWFRNIIFSIIFSIFFSLSLIILREYSSNVIRNLDDLGLKLNINKAYIIPEISEKDYLPLNILKERNYAKILEGHLYLESFRMLVLEENLHNKCLFGITSSIQGEGKSFICLNLASAIAMMNKKVAIIDCDIRKGDLTKICGKIEYIGLSDIFENEYNNLIAEYLDNLYIIPKGLTFIDPVALFSNEKFDNLLKFLYEKFDVIILDLPPVLRVAETSIIINKIDFLIFLIRASYTPIDNIKSSISKIPKNKIKTYILNGFDISSNYGYKQKYYYRIK